MRGDSFPCSEAMLLSSEILSFPTCSHVDSLLAHKSVRFIPSAMQCIVLYSDSMRLIATLFYSDENANGTD